MDKDLFTTRFKKQCSINFGDVQKAMSECEINYVNMIVTKYDNTLLIVECDEYQYKCFTRMLEELYPGMCVFGV